MTTKLTLSVDQHLIAEAKRVARDKKLSLSKIVTKALEDMIHAEERKRTKNENIGPLVSSLMGIIDVPADYNWKEERHQRIVKKHG